MPRDADRAAVGFDHRPESVIGNSMGGVVAANLALWYSDMFRRIVSIGELRPNI